MPDCGDDHWVSNWSASPTNAIGGLEAVAAGVAVSPAGTGLTSNQTHRVVVTPHRGGERVRIHLSNRFGSEPVTFTRVTIARQKDGAAVEPESVRQVLFNGGSESTTAAPGSEVVTDPVPIAFSAFEPLAVSIYVDRAPTDVTGHDLGNATSYLTAPGLGDHSMDTGADAFARTITRVSFVSRMDVVAPTDVTTVVAFGDSITDGHVGNDPLGAPKTVGVVDQNVRYPDFLQRRLDEAGGRAVVTNAGIGGNRLTRDTPSEFPKFGLSGVSRAQADVINQAGVSDVIVLMGINDIGTPIGVTYEEVVAGYTNVIDQFHGAGLSVHLGTLLPASNSVTHGALSIPPAEPVRARINSWIRSQRLSDSVIDFDAALRDPDNHSILDRRYASTDNLHPNPGGYKAMAAAVDIAKLAGDRCTAEAGQ
ncbi:GDSL-type esterase/lipase family protein [Rhodococcus maanshanensis]|uniref:GDSL-type esterase/lipase family protein n=1 Tax=Rhodococcus maanshanensis TaxID=183556 RepID=UPI0009333C5D|nr:GDSL-type esterase/lipase family protein [Rhodococcus maanshanensis]